MSDVERTPEASVCTTPAALRPERGGLPERVVLPETESEPSVPTPVMLEKLPAERSLLLMSEEERTPEPLRCATPVPSAEMVRVPLLLMVWLPPTVRPVRVPTPVMPVYAPVMRAVSTVPVVRAVALRLERPEPLPVAVPAKVMLPAWSTENLLELLTWRSRRLPEKVAAVLTVAAVPAMRPVPKVDAPETVRPVSVPTEGMLV